MAGGFAHITAIGFALNRLKDIDSLTPADKRSLFDFRPYVEVGAIAPDYPYLGGQSKWADNMHYRYTGDMIRRGIIEIGNITPSPARDRCFAWFLGYAAHVATDLAIHPIVEAKVGAYKGHEEEHRTCEMHQDAFIWQRNDIGEIGVADYVRQMIEHCSTEDGDLDPDVTQVWTRMLAHAHPEDFTSTPPAIARWNKGFKAIVDAVDDAGELFSFTRHTLAEHGLVYPSGAGINDDFIVDLDTPEGKMNYGPIFNRAIDSIVSLWSTIGKILNTPSTDALADIPDGDLDTGKRLSDGRTFIYWRTT